MNWTHKQLTDASIDPIGHYGRRKLARVWAELGALLSTNTTVEALCLCLDGAAMRLSLFLPCCAMF